MFVKNELGSMKLLFCIVYIINYTAFCSISISHNLRYENTNITVIILDFYFFPENKKRFLTALSL
jgi:hypothetical protein